MSRTRVYRGVMIEYRDVPGKSGGWYILNGPTYDNWGMKLPEPPYQDWYVEKIINDMLDTGPEVNVASEVLKKDFDRNPNPNTQPEEKSIMERLSILSILCIFLSIAFFLFAPMEYNDLATTLVKFSFGFFFIMIIVSFVSLALAAFVGTVISIFKR